MKFREYVGYKKPVKKNVEFYLGFCISKKSLKRIHDYIKSWFIRYHIPFESINPYLTLYLLDNLPNNKKNIIYKLKSLKKDILYSPEGKGNITLYDGNKKEIWLNYSENLEFQNEIENFFISNNINIKEKICYIRLFEIKEMMDEKLLSDMCYSMPRFQKLKLGNVGLLRKEKNDADF